MNAIVQPDPPAWEAAGMRLPDLTEVMAVERQAYPVPWTHGNFVDSLAAGYPSEVLRGPRAALLGYWVAMPGVDELHLLNITVAPAWQGRGLAVVMLDRIVSACRQRGLSQLWLEVRVSNARARDVYLRYGFAEVGRRRAYYPVPQGAREDAVLMSLMVAG
ncbi:ribosomal protein S18-alanine N-acetyltransferase [Roseateles saccharophilus]|uniref:[Ribosomal protein bS18]-alanine N-acetyltransferase n=1 Tax=Roseateles saccharophilus TaxID=304 RepID=A0A4R3VC83_ROSSA|nr:ribosomal protein S18-alanine N-acetyltransferase [Roseateles saccharophilus]MDG0831771.1 ribosomal-protein-alanine N-acetyltransferase [Roseateles saccharophilus]TCV01208.1 [SSU ribosomal protein S18P]-alanine acetyltransferase [Roseateles saccharophilus]